MAGPAVWRIIAGVQARGEQMNRIRVAPLSFIKALVVSGSVVGGVALAAEAEPVSRPSPQAALETLLQSSAGQTPSAAAGSGAAATSPASPSAATASGRPQVAVQRGQSLDALIRQHLASSPLRVEVLRDLIHQLNPQAFAPGGGHRLLAGARLQLPTLDDQARHAFGKTAPRSLASREDVGETTAGAWGNGAAAAARRGWVRFP